MNLSRKLVFLKTTRKSSILPCSPYFIRSYFKMYFFRKCVYKIVPRIDLFILSNRPLGLSVSYLQDASLPFVDMPENNLLRVIILSKYGKIIARDQMLRYF
jgi:hypothetical protein